jgi:hypothetical protein
MGGACLWLSDQHDLSAVSGTGSTGTAIKSKKQCERKISISTETIATLARHAKK